MWYASATGLKTVDLNPDAVKEVDKKILDIGRSMLLDPIFIGDKPELKYENVSDTDVIEAERANMARQQYLQMVYSHYTTEEKQEELDALETAAAYNFRMLSTQTRDNFLPVPDWNTGMAIIGPIEDVQRRLSMMKVIIKVPVKDTSPMPEHPKLVAA